MPLLVLNMEKQSLNIFSLNTKKGSFGKCICFSKSICL